MREPVSYEKKKQQEKIQRDVADFLAKGGKIVEYPIMAEDTNRPQRKNNNECFNDTFSKKRMAEKIDESP